MSPRSAFLASWMTIVICQLQLFRWSQKGRMSRPTFQLWGSPYTGYATLVFLFGVLVLMGFDYPVGTWTVASLIVVIPALMIGWYSVRGRVLQIAAEREGPTGPFPVLPVIPPPLEPK